MILGISLTYGLLCLLSNPKTSLPVAHAADLPGNGNAYFGHSVQSVLDTADECNNKTATKTVTASLASDFRSHIPGLEPCNTYAVYYGPLDEQAIVDLKAFDLVVLHPGNPGNSNITQAQVIELQAAGVIVLIYVSIGEEPPGIPRDGDLGPVHYDPAASCAGVPNRRCGNNGVASYYLDEIINATSSPGHDGLPDINQQWSSYYMDAASPSWWDRVRFCGTIYTDCNFYGTDYVIHTLSADGLFLDTVDTASPWHSYAYTLEAMADFIATISEWYSEEKYIVLNRGVFFAEPDYYAGIVRPRINGLVFEHYYHEFDRDYWARKLHTEANKVDGYTVFALDYFEPTQYVSITNQISETVREWGWLDYISRSDLDIIRWDLWNYYREHDLACVGIDGPKVATLGAAHEFYATVKPATTTLPITYNWQPEDITAITHIGNINDIPLCQYK
jgi:hypothetical protein